MGYHCQTEATIQLKSRPQSTQLDPATMSSKDDKTCLICIATIPSTAESFQTSCGHTWCKGCLSQGVAIACQQEDSFPPKCCTEITVEQARKFLDKQLLNLFLVKKIEYGTRERLYCHNPACQRFLQQAEASRLDIKCPKCNLSTCGTCKAKAHQGYCRANEDDQSFRAAVAQAGYQQCSSCKRVIEKVAGCNHITYVFPLRSSDHRELTYS